MVPCVLKSESQRYRLHLLPKFLSTTKTRKLCVCCVFQTTRGSWSGAHEPHGVPAEHKPAEDKEHLTYTGAGRRALPKMNPRQSRRKWSFLLNTKTKPNHIKKKPYMDELARLTTEIPTDKQDFNKVITYNRACRSPFEMETLPVQPVTAPQLKPT